jgi:hypothetical protein
MMTEATMNQQAENTSAATATTNGRRVAKLVFVDGKYQAVFNGRVLCKSASKEYVVGKIRGRDCARATEVGVYEIEDENHFMMEGVLTAEEADDLEDSVDFDINTRFEFLETLVSMIVSKNIPSLLITGEGGLGKTFTVKKVIGEAGLADVGVELAAARVAQAMAAKAKADEEVSEDSDDAGDIIDAFDRKNPGDYIFVKGYSTAKGLYRILFENRDKIVIFDDCDSIFKNQDAINLIKAAADSYDERWVSWYSENPFSDLPTSFKFEGQIIFISNFSYHRVDQAIRSRSMCVDLSMSIDQKIERMFKIVESPEFMPEVSIEAKTDAVNFLQEKRRVVRDLTLRSLISVIKIRVGGDANWKQLAEYIVRTN